MSHPAARAAIPWPILLTLLAALGLRTCRLGQQELRGDEAFGFFFSQQSFSEIIRSTLRLAEPHPVAGYFVEKAWLAAGGSSEFALRFPSACWGVAAVALTYAFARRLRFRREAAVLAAALLAISPNALWHSQDARMYSMSLALTLGSSILALIALGGAGWQPWTGYVAVTWLAINTHYYAVYVLAAQNLVVGGWALARWGRSSWRKRLPRWLAAQAAVTALAVPWFLAAWKGIAAYRGNGDSPQLGAALIRAMVALSGGEQMVAPYRNLLPVLGLALAVAGAWSLWQTGRGRLAAGWLLSTALVPIVATWAGSLARPIFDERYLVAALPPVCLLAAASWAHKQTGTRGVAPVVRLLAALVMISLQVAGHWGLVPGAAASKDRGWRALAGTLHALGQGVDQQQLAVAENYPDPTLWYYYAAPDPHLVLPPAALDRAGSVAWAGRLKADGVKRVLLPLQPSAAWDPGGIAAGALFEQYALVGQLPSGSWTVNIYDSPSPLDSIWPVAAFERGFQLDQMGLRPAVLVAGGLLAVHLGWACPPGGLRGGEALFVHLVNSEGRIVAQADPLLEAGMAGGVVSVGLALPPVLATGPWTLLAGVYQPNLPGAPRLRAAGGEDQVSLASFESAEVFLR